MYDWKNPKHKVIGYRVTSDVTLKLRDFTKIGALTEQLADIEDTQNQSVNYTLEDIEQAKAKASEDALKKGPQPGSSRRHRRRTHAGRPSLCLSGREPAKHRAHVFAQAHGAVARPRQRRRPWLTSLRKLSPSTRT